MDIREFLGALEENVENSGKMALFEAGAEGSKVPAEFQKALEAANVPKYDWVYKPEGYDLVVLEHNKDGEKAGSWGMAFFTEAAMRGAEEKAAKKKLFAQEEGQLYEAEVGMKVLDYVPGNFLDIVKLAIEVASNKQYKKGFTPTQLTTLKSKAKAKK
jgi:hypothetical protein